MVWNLTRWELKSKYVCTPVGPKHCEKCNKKVDRWFRVIRSPPSGAVVREFYNWRRELLTIYPQKYYRLNFKPAVFILQDEIYLFIKSYLFLLFEI